MSAGVVGELLDVDRLGAWLDGQGLGVGAPITAQRLEGGRSNVMFTIDRAEHRWVLRRPATVAVERSNDGMRREFQILTALDGTAAPHPAAVAICEDQDVLGCTFYLMQRVDGVSPIPPPTALDDPAHRAEIALAMVDALARIHLVDWRHRGLADLGRPEQFHERQVSRWSRQLASYQGRDLPGIGGVMSWLDAHRPAHFERSLMHGDYHMLNVLISPEPPGRVLAVIDWETATIGDPLLDLAGFCEIWRGATGDGWPTVPELIEHYRAVRGIGPIGDLTYYEVLYNFRLAVLLEGIYQRSLLDPNRPDQQEMGERALFNTARAVELASA